MLVDTDGRLYPRRERVHVRMNDMREQLEAVHESRARPAEIRRAVRDVDASVAYRGHVVPPGHTLEQPDLLHRTLGGEAAARDEDDLGLPRDHLLPSQHARLFAGGAESVDAARKLHELRIPMPGREGRVEPLKQR